MIHMTDIDVRRTLFAQSRYLIDSHAISTSSPGKAREKRPGDEVDAIDWSRVGGGGWGSIVTRFKLCGVR